MKILVPVKRVVDFNVKVRVKSDGSGVELAAYQLTLLTARPRPHGVRIIGPWEGLSFPSAPVAALAVTLVGMIYALLPPETCERLGEVKRRWDPDGLIRANHAVSLTPA